MHPNPSTPERRLLHSERLLIDKKEFLFDLHENHLGRCLKITEYYKGHRNFIVVPISGIEEFRDTMAQFQLTLPKASDLRSSTSR